MWKMLKPRKGKRWCHFLDCSFLNQTILELTLKPNKARFRLVNPSSIHHYRRSSSIFLSLFMAASVNNIAATFATVPKTSSTSSSSSSSSNPHETKLSLSLSHKSISISWNLHKNLPRSQRSSLLNLYGAPGPSPNGSISTVHPRPLMITPKASKPFSVCIGDKLPNITLSYLDPNDGAKLISLSTLCKGKRVILVGVSTPFSPRCTRFVRWVASAKDNSSDLIACVAANDAFVMRAWGEALAVGDRVMMLSDGRGELGNALGVSLNLNTTTDACLVITFNGVIKSVEFDKEEGSLVATKSMANWELMGRSPKRQAAIIFRPCGPRFLGFKHLSLSRI